RMHSAHTGRPAAPAPTERLRAIAGIALLALLVLTGCSSGMATDARRDEARDARLPEQLEADQATRTAERYFPPTSTPGTTVPEPAGLEELVLTFGFRGDGTPDGSYESVPAGVGTVYAAARVSGVSAGQIVGAVVTDAWGNDLARPSVMIDPGAADRWLALPIGIGGNVAPGEYGVYIEIDDQVVGSLAFGITSPGSSAQLLPEAPANPQVRATLPPPGAAAVATGTASPDQQGQQGQAEPQWQEQQGQSDPQWQDQQGQAEPQWQPGQGDQPWLPGQGDQPWQLGQDGQSPPEWPQVPQG
ncbi:MAG: hypothetical protein KC442_20740, partial [Thermomicrobiales bacterium]|nr:hypothetical protein [Thermomicrobiales bacterium]